MNGYYFGYDFFFFLSFTSVMCVYVCIYTCGVCRYKVSTCFFSYLLIISFHFRCVFIFVFFSLQVFVAAVAAVFVIFVYFGQIERYWKWKESTDLIIFFFFIFEYNLWWSQKICELRFMQIKEKLPKTIQMWLCWRRRRRWRQWQIQW